MIVRSHIPMTVLLAFLILSMTASCTTTGDEANAFRGPVKIDTGTYPSEITMGPFLTQFQGEAIQPVEREAGREDNAFFAVECVDRCHGSKMSASATILPGMRLRSCFGQ